MTDIQANNEVTEASQESNTQVTEKTYSQKEFDDNMAKLKSSIEHKFQKKFEQLGDIDELLSLREAAKKQQEDIARKNGEFDKILQEKLSIKEQEISKRDSIIKEYKINTPLLESASKHRAINAEQVRALLSSHVKLNDEGDVEVIDSNGSVKYKDDGTRYSVDDLVSEFLKVNTHFVSPGLATTHSKSNISGTQSDKIDVSSLNMNDPADRKRYAEYRKQQKII